MSKPLKIGITGNIGSGKSMLSTIFRTIGIPVYDCDTEAKKLMQKDIRTSSKIMQTFGKECYTPAGELDRRHLASIIFNDTSALQKINSIVHPRVREDFEEWSKKQSSAIVAVESAILFECGLHDSVDIAVVVYADRETCIARACRRNNATRHEVEQRLNEQIAAESLIARSDYAICNNPNTPLLPQISTMLSKIAHK